MMLRNSEQEIYLYSTVQILYLNSPLAQLESVYESASLKPLQPIKQEISAQRRKLAADHNPSLAVAAVL